MESSPTLTAAQDRTSWEVSIAQGSSLYVSAANRQRPYDRHFVLPLASHKV